jgi:hypothetical protein
MNLGSRRSICLIFSFGSIFSPKSLAISKTKYGPISAHRSLMLVSLYIEDSGAVCVVQCAEVVPFSEPHLAKSPY